MPRPYSAWVGPALVCLAAGCSAAPGSLTGRVTFEGEALNAGTVILHTKDGVVLPSPIYSDGTYSFEKVPPGPVTLTVHTNRTPPRGQFAGATQNFPALPPGQEAIKGEKTSMIKTIGKYVELPERYGTEDQSPFKLTVQSGPQDYNLAMTK